MIALTGIFEVSAALEDGSLDVYLRALLGFRAWHMVVEHEAELGSDALIHVVQAGDTFSRGSAPQKHWHLTAEMIQ